MTKLSDDNIIASWHKNARPWVNAIRNNEIPSRVLVTNQAIIDTITQLAPKTVLDIGCGEGWLVRELIKGAIDCLGVDGVPALVDSAYKGGAGRFKTLSYAQLANNELHETFDLAVCNFSLLGNESVNGLFQAIPSLLNKDGYFVVQTLHPLATCGAEHYTDGWREGSWDGFSDQFHDPAPWYFRTLESWQALFTNHDLPLKQIIEPTKPDDRQPISIIFVAQRLTK